MVERAPNDVSRGAIVWFTGLPSSGKSTLARAAEQRLRTAGTACCLLDGDEVREALVPRPGYDATSRDTFYATLGNLATLLESQGLVVLVAATAHRREYRQRVRERATRFLEVWVDVAVEECRRRDAKGVYAAFAERRVQAVPGEDLVYELPLRPEVVARGGDDEAALARLTELLAVR